MTEEKDLNSIPMDELTRMVSDMTIWDAENLNEPKDREASKEVQEAQTSQPEGDSPKEEVKEEEKEVKEEKEEKKQTPDSIKKLLHQRSELRQDNDRLKTELEEAKEQLRKLRSWELDAEFKNSDWELDLEKKEEAIQDASQMSKIIEREYNNSNRNISSNRDNELAKFFMDNPDLTDVKEDIVDYANKHNDLDIEDIKYLVLSKIDPTRLLDEHTKHKLSWWYDINWTDYTWPKEKEKDVKDMSSKELLSKIEELGIL